MIELRGEAPVRLLSDVHGCLLRRGKLLGGTPYIESGITDAQLYRIEKLVDEAKRRNDPEFLFQFGVKVPDVVEHTHDHIMRQAIHEEVFFDRYSTSDDAIKGFREVASRGTKMTLFSGTLGCCERKFRKEMLKRGVWENLDPELSAFLTPFRLSPELAEIWGDDRIGSPALKLMIVEGVKLLDGASPEVIEDADEIAHALTEFSGVVVYNPKKREEALAARRYKDPDYPGREGGIVIYNANIARIPDFWGEANLEVEIEEFKALPA